VWFAVEGEETGEVENSNTGVSGKVQINAAGAKVKSWFWGEGRTGVAGTGCDSGEAGAQQHGMPQWQVWATRPTWAADACTGTGVPASNRLQTMANIVFTVRISGNSRKEAQPLLASFCQFLAFLCSDDFIPAIHRLPESTTFPSTYPAPGGIP
jgi:hypothetical protein